MPSSTTPARPLMCREARTPGDEAEMATMPNRTRDFHDGCRQTRSVKKRYRIGRFFRQRRTAARRLHEAAALTRTFSPTCIDMGLGGRKMLQNATQAAPRCSASQIENKSRPIDSTRSRRHRAEWAQRPRYGRRDEPFDRGRAGWNIASCRRRDSNLSVGFQYEPQPALLLRYRRVSEPG